MLNFLGLKSLKQKNKKILLCKNQNKCEFLPALHILLQKDSPIRYILLTYHVPEIQTLKEKGVSS